MIPNPHKCRFILFEGIDGSGKSQQYTRFQNLMRAFFPQIATAYAKEPDERRSIGKVIYEILNGRHPTYNLQQMQPYHFQAFYIEDRMWNYRMNIIPSLQNGIHLLQDRGVASSFCYGAQSPAEFYDFMGLHDRIFSAAQMSFFWPDMILIFDVPAEVAVERMKASGKQLDQFETVEMLKRVRDNYRAFAETYPNCVVVDGTAKEEDVFIQTRTHLLSLLGLSEQSGA